MISTIPRSSPRKNSPGGSTSFDEENHAGILELCVENGQHLHPAGLHSL